MMGVNFIYRTELSELLKNAENTEKVYELY